ncbi:hypothetical protein Tco_1052403 [Tanacetum coccineum]
MPQTTLAITEGPANVGGESPKRTNKGKKIATDDVESLMKLVPASKVVQEDPNEPIRRKRTKSRRLEITKTEVIKIVQEEAEKIKIDPKKIISAKAGEKFKKAQDAEMQVLKKEHLQKGQETDVVKQKKS